MKRRRNLIFSFFISFALHGIVMLSVAGFMMVGNSELIPVFRHGFSSVTVTLVEPAKEESAPVVNPEPRKEVPKPVVVKREEKIVVKAPEPPAKVPVVTPEPPKPVVAMKPVIGDVITDEEFDTAPETAALEDNMDAVSSVNAEEPVSGKSAGESNNGDRLDKGVQSFADTESFIDIHPFYPNGARLRGEEGVVVVRVTVSPGGRAEKVEVIKSSGYAALDESAVDSLKKARFVAKNGGTVRGGEVTLPFRFKLVN